MKYKYKLKEDYNYQSDILNKRFTGIDNDIVWLEIFENGMITVHKDYSWDGTTLSPDYPETYYPSLVHDALYQFLPNTPFTRKQIDDIFLKMMKENNFKFAKMYYRAVRLFGGIFVKVTR